MRGKSLKKFEQIALSGVVLILLGATACVTPDRDRMKLGISRRAMHGTAATGMDTRVKSDPGMDGQATIFLPQEKSGFEAFMLGLSVDNEESALHHFQSRFLGVYLNLRNDGPVPVEFDTQKLVLKTEHEDLKPVENEKLPKALNRINWKGNIKNAYNAAAVTAGTVAIIATAIMCLEDNNCGAVIRATHTAVNLGSKYAEKASERENKIFSSPTHDTKLIYDNLLPARSTIPPGGNVEGLVFFPRPKKFTVARVFWKKDGVKEEDY